MPPDTMGPPFDRFPAAAAARARAEVDLAMAPEPFREAATPSTTGLALDGLDETRHRSRGRRALRGSPSSPILALRYAVGTGSCRMRL
jgi:hypothetical protein